MWKTGLKVKINIEQEKMVNRGKLWCHWKVISIHFDNTHHLHWIRLILLKYSVLIANGI